MWDELYEKHYPELLRYACAACGNRAEAEDAAQEVFLKALQNADTFLDLGPSQRRAWLYRALRNHLCDRYRRSALENDYLQSCQVPQDLPDPGIQEVENRLLLSALTPEDRALFTLRYQQGYNATELAQLFHIPPGTIRARLSRVRDLLKHELNEYGGKNHV